MTEIVLVGVFGILAGGLINALADDLPARHNPRLPHYADGTRRPLTAWLGISAFLFRQRSAAGTDKAHGRLSWRHPITELAAATLMMLAYVQAGTLPDMTTAQQFVWLIYVAIFVLITIIDIEHKLILFVVIVPSALVALVDAWLVPGPGPSGLASLAGGAFGFGIFFVFYKGGALFTYLLERMRQQTIDTVAFGYGDVMLATVSGLVLGLESMVVAIFITVFLGAIGALAYLAGQSMLGRRYTAFSALPYGPYIAAAALMMLLYREPLRLFVLGY